MKEATHKSNTIKVRLSTYETLLKIKSLHLSEEEKKELASVVEKIVNEEKI